MISEDMEWHEVCAIDDIALGAGLPVQVAGEHIAIIRTRAGQLAALSNFDPFSRAFVIARGVVRDHAGVPTVASPIYEQNFCLETGECLEDDAVRLAVFPVRVRGGRVQVALRPRQGLAEERPAVTPDPRGSASSQDDAPPALFRVRRSR